MMKRLLSFLMMAMTVMCAASQGNPPSVEESLLGCARRVFPMGQEWKTFPLPERVTVLLLYRASDSNPISHPEAIAPGGFR